jgi:hypothetical protein
MPMRCMNLLYLLPLLLGTCACGPTFDTGGINRLLTPQGTTSRPQ